MIGCGNIAGPYVKTMANYPDEIELLGVADMDAPRAESFAGEHGVRAYPTPDALLADDDVQMVVNLTTHHAHRDVTTQILEAGKHVHSEKPLALSHADAEGLVALAKKVDRRLGCSPCTLMGEAQQTAWKLIRDGKLGPVRVIYAECNWGRIESWHPAPGSFYQVGALWDVGVYPLSIATGIFGPARRVLAYGRTLYPNRVTMDGTPFTIEAPDWTTATIELEDGPVVRLTANFYVGHSSMQKGMEFHGDDGSLHIASWQDYWAPVQFSEFGKPYQEVELVRPPFKGIEWGRAVWDMSDALEHDRPHRATGEQAAHVVEILEAISTSMKTGAPVEVHSSFKQPAPMEWAL